MLPNNNSNNNNYNNKQQNQTWKAKNYTKHTKKKKRKRVKSKSKSELRMNQIQILFYFFSSTISSNATIFFSSRKFQICTWKFPNKKNFFGLAKFESKVRCLYSKFLLRTTFVYLTKNYKLFLKKLHNNFFLASNYFYSFLFFVDFGSPFFSYFLFSIWNIVLLFINLC